MHAFALEIPTAKTELPEDLLRDLLAEGETPRVSFVLPATSVGVEAQQGPIRLKNLLRQAEEALLPGLGEKRTAALLAPARQLLEQGPFWRAQNGALVVLVAPGFCQCFGLPMPAEERLELGPEFLLTPLVPLLPNEDERFHLLALSQKHVRLFAGDRQGLTELFLPGAPKSLVEALGEQWHGETLQFHSAGAGHKAIFHGKGGAADETKEEISRFFQRLDAALRDELPAPLPPLVLAGVDFEQAIFRHVSHHPRLLPEGLHTNPALASVETLHELAWKLVEPVFETPRNEALERCRARLGTGLASTHLGEILPAAFDGRVETLLLAEGARRYGRFDRESREVELYDEPTPGDTDLVIVAALETLRNGGKVFTVAAAELPDGATLAALFRY